MAWINSLSAKILHYFLYKGLEFLKKTNHFAELTSTLCYLK